MEVKRLKPYKSFIIEKSWNIGKDGKQVDVVYTAYTEDADGVFTGAKTLAELKQKIDEYLR